jgi:hypothetical protein
MVEIAVVVEAEADAKIIRALADRILTEEGSSWIEDHMPRKPRAPNATQKRSSTD